MRALLSGLFALATFIAATPATAQAQDTGTPGYAVIGSVVLNLRNSGARLIDPDQGIGNLRYEWQKCSAPRTQAEQRVPDATICSSVEENPVSPANGYRSAVFLAVEGSGAGKVNVGDYVRVRITYRDTPGGDADQVAFSDTMPVVRTRLSSTTSDKQPQDRTQDYVGDTLTAGTFSQTGVTFRDYAYQWRILSDTNAADQAISGATGRTYTILPGDTDKRLTVVVSAVSVATSTGSTQRVTVISAPIAVNNAPTSVNIDRARVGVASTARVRDLDFIGGVVVDRVNPTSADDLRMFADITYSWQVCAISGCADPQDFGQDQATYTPTPAQLNKFLRVKVVYDDRNNDPPRSQSAESSWTRIGEPPLPLDNQDLANTVIPDVSVTIFDAIAGAVRDRVQVARGGSATGNASQLNLGEASSNQYGFWGVGSYQSLSGESADAAQKVAWDGGLAGFTLGGDVKLSDGKLFGIALNRQSGDLEVQENNTHDYEVAVTSVSPYLGLSIGDYQLAANLSFGSGDGKLSQRSTSATPVTHDLSMTGGSVGGNGKVWQSGKSGLTAKADLLLGSTKVTPTGEASSNEAEQHISVSRLRLSALGHHDFSQSLKLTAELGARLDSGDGSGGLGVELGAGARYAAGSLKLHAKFRTLALQTKDVGEFGAEVGLQIAPGSDRQGLSLSITPTYGKTASKMDTLWQQSISKLAQNGGDAADPKIRINARAGYGFYLGKSNSVLTPYLDASLGNAHFDRHGFGLNWQPRRHAVELDLRGERRATQQRIRLKGALSF